MAKPDSQRPILPSILDRLIDETPEASREAPPSAQQFLRELRQSVRRDVENLLNTRQHFGGAPEDSTELARSVWEYGIPDVSGTNLSSRRRRTDFLRALELELREHEPRFKTVKVAALDDDNPTERTLRFRIDALVHAEPAPESVQLDSRIEPVTRAFQVRI